LLCLLCLFRIFKLQMNWMNNEDLHTFYVFRGMAQKLNPLFSYVFPRLEQVPSHYLTPKYLHHNYVDF
jgi:hypothetical protein